MGHEYCPAIANMFLHMCEREWVDSMIFKYGEDEVHRRWNNFRSFCRQMDDIFFPMINSDYEDNLPTTFDYANLEFSTTFQGQYVEFIGLQVRLVPNHSGRNEVRFSCLDKSEKLKYNLIRFPAFSSTIPKVMITGCITGALVRCLSLTTRTTDFLDMAAKTLNYMITERFYDVQTVKSAVFKFSKRHVNDVGKDIVQAILSKVGTPHDQRSTNIIQDPNAPFTSWTPNLRQQAPPERPEPAAPRRRTTLRGRDNGPRRDPIVTRSASALAPTVTHVQTRCSSTPPIHRANLDSGVHIHTSMAPPAPQQFATYPDNSPEYLDEQGRNRFGLPAPVTLEDTPQRPNMTVTSPVMAEAARTPPLALPAPTSPSPAALPIVQASPDTGTTTNLPSPPSQPIPPTPQVDTIELVRTLVSAQERTVDKVLSSMSDLMKSQNQDTGHQDTAQQAVQALAVTVTRLAEQRIAPPQPPPPVAHDTQNERNLQSMQQFMLALQQQQHRQLELMFQQRGESTLTAHREQYELLRLEANTSTSEMKLLKDRDDKQHETMSKLIELVGNTQQLLLENSRSAQSHSETQLRMLIEEFSTARQSMITNTAERDASFQQMLMHWIHNNPEALALREMMQQQMAAQQHLASAFIEQSQAQIGALYEHLAIQAPSTQLAIEGPAALLAIEDRKNLLATIENVTTASLSLAHNASQQQGDLARSFAEQLRAMLASHTELQQQWLMQPRNHVDTLNFLNQNFAQITGNEQLRQITGNSFPAIKDAPQAPVVTSPAPSVPRPTLRRAVTVSPDPSLPDANRSPSPTPSTSVQDNLDFPPGKRNRDETH
jgi:hypothetical protein